MRQVDDAPALFSRFLIHLVSYSSISTTLSGHSSILPADMFILHIDPNLTYTSHMHNGILVAPASSALAP